MFFLKLSYLLLVYLVAAIPFGLIFCALFAGVDVREVGSGNIGATNALRAGGKTIGAATLAADLLKGLLPVLGAWALFEGAWVPGLVAVIAVIGHCWPVYLEFEGGKGVATGAGAMLGVAPWAALGAVVIWAAIFAVGRRSSLAGLGATFVLPLLVIWLYPEAIWPALLLVGVIGARHKENIKRLAAGTEARIGG